MSWGQCFSWFIVYFLLQQLKLLGIIGEKEMIFTLRYSYYDLTVLGRFELRMIDAWIFSSIVYLFIYLILKDESTSELWIGDFTLLRFDYAFLINFKWALELFIYSERYKSITIRIQCCNKINRCDLLSYLASLTYCLSTRPVLTGSVCPYERLNGGFLFPFLFFLFYFFLYILNVYINICWIK